MVFLQAYDLQRHLKTVHGVTDCEKHDIASRCSKVVKMAPIRPLFAPVTGVQLGMAVRNCVIANSMLLHKKAARVRTPRRRKQEEES